MTVNISRLQVSVHTIEKHREELFGNQTCQIFVSFIQNVNVIENFTTIREIKATLATEIKLTKN